MAEFEPLFQGLRESLVGDEQKAPISSYEDWKRCALAGFAKGDTLLQASMRAERAGGRNNAAEA